MTQAVDDPLGTLSFRRKKYFHGCFVSKLTDWGWVLTQFGMIESPQEAVSAGIVKVDKRAASANLPMIFALALLIVFIFK
jgi:hypothetical protein